MVIGASIALAACVELLGGQSEKPCRLRPTPERGDRFAKPAGKGVELYSWRAPDGTFVYSVLWGTNREKSVEQVKRPSCVLRDVAALKAALAGLAVGESVFWFNKIAGREDDFAVPPSDIVDELVSHCKAIGVRLEVYQTEKPAGTPSGTTKPQNNALNLAKRDRPCRWLDRLASFQTRFAG